MRQDLPARRGGVIAGLHLVGQLLHTGAGRGVPGQRHQLEVRHAIGAGAYLVDVQHIAKCGSVLYRSEDTRKLLLSCY